MASNPSTQRTYDSAVHRSTFVSELTELWDYRYLLSNLVSRDLKVRYKRSTLGFAWAMLNPLLTMLVLATVFSALFRFEVESYATYVLTGLLIWNFFSQGSTQAMTSVLNNAPILTKIYVPSSVFVSSAVASAFVNLLFALVPLLLVAVTNGVTPAFSWLLVFVPVLQTALLALGVGFIVATLAVYYQDVVDIYQVLLNVYFYLTPIIYPADILPGILRQANALNPLFHILNNMRAIVIAGTAPPLRDTLLGSLIPVAVLVIGWLLFSWKKNDFAYHL